MPTCISPLARKRCKGQCDGKTFRRCQTAFEQFQHLPSKPSRTRLGFDFYPHVRTVADRIDPRDTKKPTTTANKMKSVKAVWDKAPAGPKNYAALKHYQAAEKAQTARNHTEANHKLDATTHASA